MRITETQCKTLLVSSKLPAADYVVNPYTGCTFKCAYCYASFMGRFVGEPIESWGDYLLVKTNAVEVFRNELRRLPDKKRGSTIFISSVTDAWQGPEKKYRLTRGVLEALREDRYPGLVSMLTKSPLVLRDVDVISGLVNKEIGITVTTTDDQIGRFLEAFAPSASDRLEALAILNNAGIPTYAFLGPLLPHYRFRKDLLEDLFRGIRDAGTKKIFAEHLNTSRYIQKRMSSPIRSAEPEVQALYRSAQTQEHRAALSDMVLELVQKYGFEIELGHVIDHSRVRIQ